MSDDPSSPRRIPVWADPDLPGDVPAMWDLFWADEAEYEDLPPSDQHRLRSMIAKDRGGVQVLEGSEQEVRYLPGDAFTNVDRAWLLPRLVLGLTHGRVHTSPHSKAPGLSCLLDGEVLDPLQEEGNAIFLGPGRDFRSHPVATVGTPDPTEADHVCATLYRAGCWLVSIRPEVATDYLPVEENEMSQEKSTGIVPEVWQWAIEMTAQWAAAGVEQDFPIASEYLDLDGDDWLVQDGTLLEYVAQAAAGGRGTVTINGVVVYQPQGQA